MSQWRPSKSSAKYGVAIYNFDASAHRHGLELSVGDTVQIMEQCGAWYKGFAIKNKSVKGIFPVSFIHLKSCKVDVEGPNEAVTPDGDLTVLEVSSSLPEWAMVMKKLFLDGTLPKWKVATHMIDELIAFRKTLISGSLSQDYISEFKKKVVQHLDAGNRFMGLDLVPRRNLEPVDMERTSIVEVYWLHERKVVELTSRPGTRKRIGSTTSHCLCLRMLNFMCRLSEDAIEAEVHFSLYDNELNQFFSERIITRVNKHGMAVDGSSFPSALFTDLCTSDLSRDCYLVAQVFKIGSLLDEKKPANPSAAHKRPLGCGVFALKSIFTSGERDSFTDISINIAMSAEADFASKHETLIRGGGRPPQPQSASQDAIIKLSLRLASGDTELFRRDEPLLMRDAVIVRKLGFGDIFIPGEVRNDLYVTIGRGEFEKGDKSAPKNIEVLVFAVDISGKDIENTIIRGAGEVPTTSYHSYVFHQSNKPKWNDTIKLNIPLDMFRGSHLRFEFRHISSKKKNEKQVIACGFLELADHEGKMLEDGTHEIILYRPEDSKILSYNRYKHLPFTVKGLNQLDAERIASMQLNMRKFERDTVTISTLLCSTNLTQNADLLSLLNWKAKRQDVHKYLVNLRNVDVIEIMKNLHSVLDALFEMFSMDDRIMQDEKPLIFQSLVFIFVALQDKKFEHFQAVINAYLTSNFCATLAYRDLLNCLCDKLHKIFYQDKQDEALQCIRALEHITQFAVRSQVLAKRMVCAQTQQELTAEFQSLCQNYLFVEIKTILSTTNALNIQLQLLKRLPKFVVILSEVLPPGELCTMFVDLMNGIKDNEKPGHIPEKLSCMHELIKSPLFSRSELRLVLLDTIVSHLRHYVSNDIEIKTCAEVVGDMLVALHNNQTSLSPLPGDMENSMKVLQLLIYFVDCFMKYDNRNSHQRLTYVCILGMLKLMTREYYQLLIRDMDRTKLKDFLVRLFALFSKHSDIFPSDWFQMKMAANTITLYCVSLLTSTIVNLFMEQTQFDLDLWQSFFDMAVIFVTQANLQIERFSEIKRQKIMESYGEMRTRMGFEILAMWQHLDRQRIHFVPGLVKPFLEVSLIPMAELRKIILPIFFDMMLCDYDVNGNFERVEMCLLNELDRYVSEGSGDAEYKELFNAILMDKVKEHHALQDSGCQFVKAVTLLLERLLDYRNVLDEEENCDKKMMCIVSLLNFYQSNVKRQELFIRYVYRLRDLHERASSYVEAGFTLKLHADLLSWTDDEVANNIGGSETQRQLKERLSHTILSFFDKGKAWEYGLPLCEELAEVYKRSFDYTKLSQLLETEARFYKNILGQTRHEPVYFYAAFYGLGFPLFIRNKEFVYCAESFCKFHDFGKNLLRDYPKANLLGPGAPIRDSMQTGMEQYIKTSPLRPIASQHAVFQQSGVSDVIKSFYRSNSISSFQYDRSYHVGQKEKNCEFKTMWLERTLVKTKAPLPSILRWCEVESTTSHQLRPIEVAIDTVHQMNKELESLIERCRGNDGSRVNAQQLTMKLKGVIDAEVMGGLTVYQQTFLANPTAEDKPFIDQLGEEILEQLLILNQGLELHAVLVTTELKPLHNHMATKLDELRQQFSKVNSPNAAKVAALRSQRVDSNTSLGDSSSAVLIGTFSGSTLSLDDDKDQSSNVSVGSSTLSLAKLSTQNVPYVTKLSKKRYGRRKLESFCAPSASVYCEGKEKEKSGKKGLIVRGKSDRSPKPTSWYDKEPPLAPSTPHLQTQHSTPDVITKAATVPGATHSPANSTRAAEPQTTPTGLIAGIKKFPFTRKPAADLPAGLNANGKPEPVMPTPAPAAVASNEETPPQLPRKLSMQDRSSPGSIRKLSLSTAPVTLSNNSLAGVGAGAEAGISSSLAAAVEAPAWNSNRKSIEGHQYLNLNQSNASDTSPSALSNGDGVKPPSLPLRKATVKSVVAPSAPVVAPRRDVPQPPVGDVANANSSSPGDGGSSGIGRGGGVASFINRIQDGGNPASSPAAPPPRERPVPPPPQPSSSAASPKEPPPVLPRRGSENKPPTAAKPKSTIDRSPSVGQ